MFLIKNKGYSLVETLVALAIISMLTLAMASFLSVILASEKQNRAVAEVEAQANYVLYQLSQEIRNANRIVTPDVRNISSNLHVTSSTGVNIPFKVELINGVVTSTKGSAAMTTITSKNVKVTNLSFQNLTASSTKGSVRIGLTVSYANPYGRPEFDFASTYYSTVTLR